MSNDFVRVQEAADRPKGWDAERIDGGEIPVYRQRVLAPDQALRLEDNGDGVLIIGVATPGASPDAPVWKIKKILTSGSSLHILWPEDAQGYVHAWSERGSITFS